MGKIQHDESAFLYLVFTCQVFTIIALFFGFLNTVTQKEKRTFKGISLRLSLIFFISVWLYNIFLLIQEETNKT